ncbi:hypothetical protein D1007_12531 [Hordeum vulgare]|nr:hypothetical protein D1007_12531 [Hordeum vulgare]
MSRPSRLVPPIFNIDVRASALGFPDSTTTQGHLLSPRVPAPKGASEQSLSPSPAAFEPAPESSPSSPSVFASPSASSMPARDRQGRAALALIWLPQGSVSPRAWQRCIIAFLLPHPLFLLGLQLQLASPTSSVAPLPRQSSDGARRKAEAKGARPSPTSPLLECVLSKDVDLTPVLPWTAVESNKYRRTPIMPDAIEERPAWNVVYHFFLHSVFAGLVPPFSSFFTAILNHYGIQTLHLHPNYVLLLSVLAFYCEAFVGVQPCVALLRHFFSLCLHDDAHLSACASFVAAQCGNLLLKAGKKAENFRQCWVLMGLKDANPRLEEPKGSPEKTSM